MLHNSPLLPHVQRYATLLHEQGYAANTIAQHVYSFSSFRRWLKRRRRNLGEINEQVVEEFLKDRKRDSHDGAPQAFRRLLEILRAAGATPPAETPPRTPAQRIAAEYRDYLRVERSFAPKTVENYSRYVEGFLIDRFGASRVDPETYAAYGAARTVFNRPGTRSSGDGSTAATPVAIAAAVTNPTPAAAPEVSAERKAA